MRALTAPGVGRVRISTTEITTELHRCSATVLCNRCAFSPYIGGVGVRPPVRNNADAFARSEPPLEHSPSLGQALNPHPPSNNSHAIWEQHFVPPRPVQMRM